MGRGFLTGAFWGVIVGGFILFTAALVLNANRPQPEPIQLELTWWDAALFAQTATSPKPGTDPDPATSDVMPDQLSAPVALQSVPVAGLIPPALDGHVPPLEREPVVLDGGAEAVALAISPEGPSASFAPMEQRPGSGIGPVRLLAPDTLYVVALAPNSDPGLTAPRKAPPAVALSKIDHMARALAEGSGATAHAAPPRAVTRRAILQRVVPQPDIPDAVVVLAPAPTPLPTPEADLRPRIAFVVENPAGLLPDWAKSAVLPWGAPIFPRRDAAEWVRLASAEDLRSAASAMPIITTERSTGAPGHLAYRQIATADHLTPATFQALAARAHRDGAVAVLIGDDPALQAAITAWLAAEGATLRVVALSDLTP